MSCVLKDVSIIIPLAPGETAHQVLLKDLESCNAQIITVSEKSRPKSLNKGAEKAHNEFLWFLHADSRISDQNLKSLQESLKKIPEALHYFDLEYEGGGLAALNAFGANIRSWLFGLPYGDQGFAIPKQLFDYMGGYPEHSLGEDLLFVRKLKKMHVPLQRVQSKLRTSARKYKEKGWLRLTVIRQWQLMKLMCVKL